MLDVIKLLRSGDLERIVETWGATYILENDNNRIKYWNSSNQELIHHKHVREAIIDELLEDENNLDGSISSNMNEIMYEITEI